MLSTMTPVAPVLVWFTLIGPPVAAGVSNEELKLLPGNGAEGDVFGTAVGASSGRVIVGAPMQNFVTFGSGSAYLFDGASGAELLQLLPEDGADFDQFGCSVALSGNTAVVGASGDDDNGTGSGSAYLFDATTGAQTFKLLADDGSTSDGFGTSVSISGTIVIVGAPEDDDAGSSSGSAYLFDAATGQQLHKLLPLDGALGDDFGSSVGVSGGIAIVGAILDDELGSSSGSAYLFDVATGAELGKLLAADGEAQDYFGSSVAISGALAIVGAWGDDDNGANSGAAYLFDASTGSPLAKLVPADGDLFDNFGRYVAIHGNIALVAARYDDENGLSSGSAYLFDTVSELQIGKLIPSDGAANDEFGVGVAISESLAVVGCAQDDDQGTDSGSAYLFDATGSVATVGSRNGSGVNDVILTSVTPPVLGTSWTSDLDCGGHAPGIAGLVAYEDPFEGFFLLGGELLVDVTSPQSVAAFRQHTGNVVRFSFAVPLDSSLCGFATSAQGVVLGAPGYELSNALDASAGL